MKQVVECRNCGERLSLSADELTERDDVEMRAASATIECCCKGAPA